MSGILAVLEYAGGAWHKMSFEALEAALELGRLTGARVETCLFGASVAPACAELAGYGVAGVLGVEHPALEPYTADGTVAALGPLIREVAPDWVVFPHTYRVRDFAPRLAARFERTLLSDATGFRQEGGSLAFGRQLFQGKLAGTFVFETPAPNFVSFQAGAFPPAAAGAVAAPVSVRPAQIDAAAIRQKPEPPFRESARAVDLGAAERIVSVGRGIQEEANLALVRELAAAMGAELAASRPICDNGWLPMDRQVGSSGQTVAPKLYLAVGISGAIQHLVGMKGAACIAAINKDPDAPIFEVADYGIVGDLFEVVPALTEAVKKAAC